MLVIILKVEYKRAVNFRKERKKEINPSENVSKQEANIWIIMFHIWAFIVK